MTLERGSRDDTTARSPVSARFVLSSFFRGFSLLLQRSALTLRAFSARPSFSSSPLSPLLSSERRQVGIRAAVNSPAPLSALMSLLLFALLNAIRAYSVSLPPPSRSLRYHVVLLTSSLHTMVHARTLVRSLARSRARALESSIFAVAFARSQAPTAADTHATRRRVKTCA